MGRTKAPPTAWCGVFKCKPLACPDAETVNIFLKSPTRHPDPEALEKLAKIELPKSIHALDAAREILADGDAKLETLSSKTATLKGYPAVISETKLTKGKATYLDTAIMFAGPVMIRLQSISQNRAGEEVAERVRRGHEYRGRSAVCRREPETTPGAQAWRVAE